MTLDDQLMVFTALAQTHQTTVRLKVSNNTDHGDYVFTIRRTDRAESGGATQATH